MTPRRYSTAATYALAVLAAFALFFTVGGLAPAGAQPDDPHGRYGYDGACQLFVGASGLQTSYSLFREHHDPDWVGGWVEPGEPREYFTVFDGEAFLLEITVVKPSTGDHHRIIEGTGTCPQTTTTTPTTSVPPSSTTSPTTTTTVSSGSTTTVAPVSTTAAPSATTTTTLPQPTLVDDCGPFSPPPCPPVDDRVLPPGFEDPGWINTGFVDRQGDPVLLPVEEGG